MVTGTGQRDRHPAMDFLSERPLLGLELAGLALNCVPELFLDKPLPSILGNTGIW